MDRIFKFDNKNEIKLSVDGFDCAPILIGKEQSDGDVSLEKLSQFQGCNLSIKSANIKNSDNEIIELKTYYTVVKAEHKKYDNPIVDNFERNENSKMRVEVCLGEKDNKRFIILEYPTVLNLIDVTKKIPSDIFKELHKNNHSKNAESDDNFSSNDIVNLTLYDKDGFESTRSVAVSEISKYILSIRIIETTNNTVRETVSKKTKEVFQLFKEDSKSKIEVISNFTTSVVKLLSPKKI